MQLALAAGKLGVTLDLEQWLPLAQAAGFAAAEPGLALDADAAAARALLDQHGLQAGGWQLDNLWRGSDAEHAAMVAQFPRRLAQARTLGNLTCLTWLRPASDDLSYRDNFRWHQQRLTPLAQQLAEAGGQLALEFLGPRTLRVGRRYSFIHTLEQVLELCEALGENVGVLLDCWHWHTSLGTVEDIRALPASRLLYVHVNDAPAGVPVEQLEDLERALPMTTGVIDSAGFIAALRAVGYQGLLVPEPFDASLRGQDPALVFRRTAELMRKMLDAQPRPALPRVMQSLAIGQGRTELIEQPMPRPRGQEVVIRIHTALICGSNVGSFRGEKMSLVGGHEGAGEVVTVAQPTRLKVGDRVGLSPLNACGVCEYCRRGETILCRHRPSYLGCFSQYTRVHESVCTLLPEAVSYEHGALLGCALGPAYGALRTIGVRAFDTLVVTGLGPVGLGATALAGFMGVRVLGVELDGWRRERALALGATEVFDPSDAQAVARLKAVLPSHGLRFGMDCSGAPAAQRMLIDLAAPLAQLAWVGENKQPLPVTPSDDFIRKHLTVTGVWHMNVLDQGDLLNFIQRAPQLADLLLTHRYPLHEAQAAFATFCGRQAVKVALQPSN